MKRDQFAGIRCRPDVRYHRGLQALRQRQAERRIGERVHWATGSIWEPGGPCLCGRPHREMKLRMDGTERTMCPIVFWLSWAWKEVIEKGDHTWLAKFPLSRLLGRLQ